MHKSNAGSLGPPISTQKDVIPIETFHALTEEISAIRYFEHQGRQVCSRGTCRTPEPESPGGGDLFAKLPATLLSTIFDEACGPDVLTATLEKDPMQIGWVSEDAIRACEEEQNIRRTTLIALKSVCRHFRRILLPTFYSVTVVRSSKTPADLEKDLLTPLPADSEVLASALPLSYSVGVHLEEAPAAPSPTVGSLIRTFDLRAHWLSADYDDSLATLVAHTPLLQTLHFPPDHIPDAALRDLARNVSPTLLHLRGLSLNRLNNSSIVENLLIVVNAAQALQTLAVRNAVVNCATAARLLFILKLNAKLGSTGSGNRAGLVTLSFGSNSNISRVLLEGLADAAPSLKHLHLAPGCALTDETNQSGSNGSGSNNGEFDLANFVSRVVSRLRTFTLVCGSGIHVRGNFDDLVTLCPLLQAAHIRVDHISFVFFRTLFASLRAGVQGPTTIMSGTATPASVVASTELSESELVSLSSSVGDLAPLPLRRHCALKFLRMHHSYSSPSPENKDHFVQLDGRAAIASYAKIARNAEDHGIIWPTTEGSQKDLIMRLDWLGKAAATVVKKKQEDEAGWPSTNAVVSSSMSDGQAVPMSTVS